MTCDSSGLWTDGDEEEEKQHVVDEQWLQQINVGMLLDAVNPFGQWCPASIDQMMPPEYIRVIYANMPSSFSDWIRIDSIRLAPYKTQVTTDLAIDIGQPIRIREQNGGWRSAFFVQSSDNERVQVRFEGKDSSCDVWLPYAPEHIAPLPNARSRRRQYCRKLKEIQHSRVLSTANPQYTHYLHGLSNLGLAIKTVVGDGNCLFRAVSHQIYGTDDHHGIVRACCMDYMESEKEYFEPYIEGNMDDFLRYIAEKRQNAVWGDDPEIQAMCELYDRPAEIYTYDRVSGARKLRTFHENSTDVQTPIRLSYYGGGHYDSITAESMVAGQVVVPGVMERERIERSRSRTTTGRIELRGSRNLFDCQDSNFEDILKASLAEFDRQHDKNMDLVAAQSQMIDMAQKESEEEHLKQAIQKSQEDEMNTAIQASLQVFETDVERAIRLSRRPSSDYLDELELQQAIAASMLPP